MSEVAGDMNIMFENAKKYNVHTSRLYKVCTCTSSLKFSLLLFLSLPFNQSVMCVILFSCSAQSNCKRSCRKKFKNCWNSIG